MSKKSKNIKCEDCSEYTPIGEGDQMCMYGGGENGEPALIVENYIPNENYFWCKGKSFDK
jgi:hypothetical protein